jgi:mannose-1-phosphate guanylyltransferase/mannose-1-phosphate guanylyltransferase/mannose-6-phosphate isomerase
MKSVVETIDHIVDKRPWGQFERFTLNEKSTVKIITVLSGEAFSLQYHKNRNEFWYIISGRGTVTLGEEIIKAEAGDKFDIPSGVNHRLEAQEDVKFLEIAFGDFNEDDIVRLEDKYGRK